MQVVRELQGVFRTASERARAAQASAGLTAGQAVALRAISARPGMKAGELAEELGLHQATVSNLLKPVFERGLLTQHADPDDRRLARLRVSAAGRRLLSKLPVTLVDVLAQAVAELDPGTCTRLRIDLEALEEVLGKS